MYLLRRETYCNQQLNPCLLTERRPHHCFRTRNVEHLPGIANKKGARGRQCLRAIHMQLDNVHTYRGTSCLSNPCLPVSKKLREARREGPPPITGVMFANLVTTKRALAVLSERALVLSRIPGTMIPPLQDVGGAGVAYEK